MNAAISNSFVHLMKTILNAVHICTEICTVCTLDMIGESVFLSATIYINSNQNSFEQASASLVLYMPTQTLY